MTEWIKCIDRLPEIDKHVLIYVTPIGKYPESEGIYTGYYEKAHSSYRWLIRHEVSGYEWDEIYPKVTHWAELPEVPHD